MIIAEATEHDEQVALAEELMDQEDYTGAAKKAGDVLDDLEPSLPTIAHAALTKGRALMTQTLADMSEKGELPPPAKFETIWNAYELSKKLNPTCDTTKKEMLKVSYMLREIPPKYPPKGVAKADFDVLIVGAGAAGVGAALMLTKTFGLDAKRVCLIERGHEVGESFRRWPTEMKFISPSFNQQGWTTSFDLNSIAEGTSPAFSLHSEHPSGHEYAEYLKAIAYTHKLNVKRQTEVMEIWDVSIQSKGNKGCLPLFEVDVKSTGDDEIKIVNDLLRCTLTARYIVWAAGEFQYPKKHSGSGAAFTNVVASTLTLAPPPYVDPLAAPSGGGGGQEEKKNEETKHQDDAKKSKEATPTATATTTADSASNNDIPGSELCLHNSKVPSWADLEGDDFVIIGGYESGVDAAINLSRAGKKCKVLASTPCWSVKTADPSAELAPYTAARLRDVLSSPLMHSPHLFAPLRVVRIEQATSDERAANNGMGYFVTAQWNAPITKPHAPLRGLTKDAPTEPQGDEGTEKVFHTLYPPILCTGFEGSVKARASHLFHFEGDGNKNEEYNHDHDHGDDHGDDDDDNNKKGCLAGAPLLTMNDESTKIPGVFLVGPTVSHGKLSFCFVYKFRQRFAVVANAICQGLGKDTKAAVAECRKANMYMDDFSCCGDTCGDVC